MRLHNSMYIDLDLGQPGWASVFVTRDLPGQLRTYLLSKEGRLILARVVEEEEEVPQEINFTGEVKLYASNITGWESVGGYRLREDLPEKRPVTVEYILGFKNGYLVSQAGGLNVFDEKNQSLEEAL